MLAFVIWDDLWVWPVEPCVCCEERAIRTTSSAAVVGSGLAATDQQDAPLVLKFNFLI